MPSPTKIAALFVATDFSPPADAAVRWAARRARALGARVILYHGVGAPAAPVLGGAPDVAMGGPEWTAAQRALDDLARTLRHQGISVETDLHVDLGCTTILARARAFDADLVVAGTRGQSRLRRSILGSTAARLVRESDIPVVILPPKADEPEDPIDRVLVPTDFAGDVQRTVDVVEALLGPATAQTDLTLMHVHPGAYEPASPWAAPLVLAPRSPETTEAVQRLEMIGNQLAHRLRNIDTVACGGDAARAIDREAQLLDADLIAIAHGGNGLTRRMRTSIAEKVLAGAPCAVLAIRKTPARRALAETSPSERRPHAGLTTSAG